ncbi:MAG TPA: C-GCAxxG-C-C family protein [Synergistaceae bacterium]|nr:C-GCAxxG-C-C family protein [Synergistaceae bacterium]HPJ26207.1 C-GCAxxG-C-C family protein [Synergistaceae bacterium]HPQ37502.1 C-GCAxxG-C-C family protein [Synergistaceae bacterium]
MNGLESRIIAWGQEGYCCSQMMLLAGLAFRNSENPELIASLEGLCKGGYEPSGTCGAFTGACCLLGLYAGKGFPEKEKDIRLPLMLSQLHDWFREKWGTPGDTIMCGEILKTLSGAPPLACFPLVLETLAKTLEILEKQGFDLQEDPSYP